MALDYKIEFVEPENIPYVWTALIPFVDRFLAESEGESTAASILQRLCTGQYQCWVAYDYEEIKTVVITKVDEWATYKALHILGATGLHSHCNKMHETIEDFARVAGCDRVTIWGRKGWKRLMDREGFVGKHGEKYEEKYVVLQMKLDKEV